MEALRALLESDAITEQMKSEIQEAWDIKIKENRVMVTAELREEFAKKYEHDKGVMIEAIDAMIGEKLAEEMAEFHDDRKQLAEAKARYAIAMKENANLLKRFVTESLAK
jgi:ribosomal protein S24E